MNKKVLIIGLGLIGGSIAARLKEHGYFVGGYDIDPKAISVGLEKGIIDVAVGDDEIKDYPLVVFGLYPKAELGFVEKNAGLFQKGAFVTDVIGVKAPFVPKIEAIFSDYGVRYLSVHPMAGAEKVGVLYADPKMFEGCNYLICPTHSQEEDVELAKKLGETLGAARISVLSVEDHDRIVGFLSQLPHAIAVSLMTSCDNASHMSDYTGNSFRDLTRIASINEKMWSELFLDNKETLIEEIDAFVEEMEKIKKALAENDEETLKDMMVLSTKRRKEF